MAKLFYAEVSIPLWVDRIDFDRRPVNKVIYKEARAIQRTARRLIARRAVSSPGELPGRQTGALQRSIKVFMNRKYSFAVIRPTKTTEMGTFHPFMLLRGTKTRLQHLAEGEGRGVSNRRRRGDRALALAARAASDEYRVAPREDYMATAYLSRRDISRGAIAEAVKDSLVPRKYGR